MLKNQQKLPPKFIIERKNIDKTLKEWKYGIHN